MLERRRSGLKMGKVEVKSAEELNPDLRRAAVVWHLNGGLLLGNRRVGILPWSFTLAIPAEGTDSFAVEKLKPTGGPIWSNSQDAFQFAADYVADRNLRFLAEAKKHREDTE